MLKRLFDILVSFTGLLILSPVLIIIAILIKICTPGPVFFRQTRIGRYGKPFKIIKFKTMVPSAAGTSITVKGESRITPFGAWLRRNKLDALPELMNVLKGEMSLVGPRPDVPGYADKLEGTDRILLSVRPGITSPATLKYANEEELLASQSDPVSYNDKVIWPDKVRINLNYIKRQNFFLDLKIIFLTILRRKMKDEWAN